MSKGINPHYSLIGLDRYTGKTTHQSAQIDNILGIKVGIGIEGIFLVLIAITTSSRAAFPDPLSKSVHSNLYWFAPFNTPSRELAVASPRSL